MPIINEVADSADEEAPSSRYVIKNFSIFYRGFHFSSIRGPSRPFLAPLAISHASTSSLPHGRDPLEDFQSPNIASFDPNNRFFLLRKDSERRETLLTIVNEFKDEVITFYVGTVANIK